MEFQPPLPPDASEQLARVARNVVAQSSDRAAARKPWQEYPDVEAFLDRHGETFSITEQCWRDVSDIKKQIDEFATQPIAPSEAYIDEKGVTIYKIDRSS